MGTPAPDAVKRLVDRFDQDRKVFLSGDYKEELMSNAKTPHEQESIQRQIAATDKQIDQLVYDWSDSGRCRSTAQLYGLTEDEIRIVGGATWTKRANNTGSTPIRPREETKCHRLIASLRT
jgi:hypothetical protein